jgi:hypothetical protein
MTYRMTTIFSQMTCTVRVCGTGDTGTSGVTLCVAVRVAVGVVSAGDAGVNVAELAGKVSAIRVVAGAVHAGAG